MPEFFDQPKRSGSMKRNLKYHAHVPINQVRGTQAELNGVNTTLHDIGRDGFSITCDQQHLSILLPTCASICLKSPVQFESGFSLPGQDNYRITTLCEAFGVRRLSRDNFQLNLKFIDVSEKDFAMIDAYIEARMNGKATTKIRESQPKTGTKADVKYSLRKAA